MANAMTPRSRESDSPPPDDELAQVSGRAVRQFKTVVWCHLDSSRDHAAIIHAIVALAHNLRAVVVAEGVENAEQVATLQGLDCDLAHGFHFHKPMPAANIENLIAAQSMVERAA